MTENVLTLVAVTDQWVGTVDRRHVKVAAWAIVELSDVIDESVGPETWRVVRGLTPGCEVETVPLEFVHPADECPDECPAHEPAPVAMIRKGAAA